MKLKHKVLVVVLFTGIIMFPISKIIGMSYSTLFLSALYIEAAVTVLVVFKNIDKPEYE